MFLLTDNNYLLVNFQKSRDFKTINPSFTINTGLSFGSIRSFYNHKEIDFSDVSSYHLKIRIGQYLREKQDLWWTLSENSNENEIANYITNIIINDVLPYLTALSDNAAIVGLWSANTSPGLTDFQRRCYLLIMLKCLNDVRFNNELVEFADFVKGKPFLATASLLIKELNEFSCL